MAKQQKQRVQIGTDPNGKPIYKWVTAMNQQELMLNIAETLIENGMVQSNQIKESPLFRTYAKEWFKLYKIPMLKQGTIVCYQIHIDNYLIPFFGDMQINDITTSDVQRFFNEKLSLCHSTVRQMRIILHQIFASAIEDGHRDHDPTKSGRLTMSKTVNVREALSIEYAIDIGNNISKLRPYDQLLVAIPLYTGMRRGEMLGLRLDDIDFSSKIVHVQRAIAYNSKNQPTITSTKSAAGIRMIPLEPALEAFLEPMKGNGFITTGIDDPMTECTFKRAWERIEKTIDLHGATPHVLRHTYITMAASYIDVKTLQTIAGHSDITMTMNRYAHGRTDKVKAAVTALEAMYQPSV